MGNVLGAGESVVGPALDNDASDERAIGGTDTREPLLEDVGIGEVEGLSVQLMDGFISDSLVQAENNCLKSGAVRVVRALTLGLEVVTAISVSGPLHGTAEDLTASGLADKAEFSGRFDEACLVNHEADLERQLHDGEGDILDLLGLLLAFLGSLLLLLSLELSLGRVSWIQSLRIEIVYLVGGELFVGARVRCDISGVELGVGYVVVRSNGSGRFIVNNVFVKLGRLNIVDLSASALGTESVESSHGASSSPGSVVVGVSG